MKFSRLIFANLFRKKVRLILTLGSFAVALFLFAFLSIVRGAFLGNAELASANRLVTINRTSIINLIPLSYKDKILRIPGVKSIGPESIRVKTRLASCSGGFFGSPHALYSMPRWPSRAIQLG